MKHIEWTISSFTDEQWHEANRWENKTADQQVWETAEAWEQWVIASCAERNNGHPWWLDWEEDGGMRIYLAGPMRNIPDFNHPAFRDGTRQLRNAGHEVFSPAEHDETSGLVPGGAGGGDLRKALGADLAWICANADSVAVLPGWRNSLGATAEAAVAAALGLPVRELADMLLEA